MHIPIIFRRTIALTFLLLFCPIVSAINCDRAKTAPEVAICSNPALKAFDDYLSDAYATIRSTVPADVFTEVRKNQIQWIKQRDARCGGEVVCLMRETHARTAALNGFVQKYTEKIKLWYSAPESTPPPSTEQNSPLSPSEIYRVAAQSVVVVIAFDRSRDAISQGSGVVIDLNTIATNCHVLEAAETAVVMFGGNPYEATALRGSKEMDYCILNTVGLPARAARIGKLSSVAPGQRVYSVGSPRGFELTIAEGLVSGLRKKDGVPLFLIQTSAAISPGSSGGGLFDEFGRVIGITTFLLKDSQNINFALPVELSQRFGRQ
ncbi:MAG TPA: trypsin-like peptidase domain-containing protein [Alcaligenes phenolicus]|uniref:trypsin-like peptidase domain-containing protein n=2 Tax=Betaproteobacteria TaxID=28216 RepID=UPI002CB4B66A|nr:trypsin-like peptidase domain-containing protein [Alcaligenes phenolicus]HRO22643.1 trypsin-like peptidase domain-containing protein [Alcaligenes phenolicus]